MSGRIRFNEAFKLDAVSQVVERGYSVREVADRLGISTKSLYTWKAKLSKPYQYQGNSCQLRATMKSGNSALP